MSIDEGAVICILFLFCLYAVSRGMKRYYSSDLSIYLY